MRNEPSLEYKKTLCWQGKLIFFPNFPIISFPNNTLIPKVLYQVSYDNVSRDIVHVT